MSTSLILGICLIGVASSVGVLLRSEDPNLRQIGRTVSVYLVVLPAFVTGVAMVISDWLVG